MSYRFTEADIPCLSEGKDIASLDLTPKDGFVLSRVDGKTSIAEISSISGLPIEEVMQIFEKLSSNKVIGFVAKEEKRERPREKGSLTILEQLEEDDKNDKLARIPREKRKRVLMMEKDIEGMNHYEILGLKRGALDAHIKKAYFKMTKDFHPDMFFGKDLGFYKKKLESIFQRITEAYEVLSDKKKKKNYDELTFKKEQGAEKGPASGSEKKTGPKTLIERLAEAKRYYALGEGEFKKGNNISASSYFKLALSFDPANQLYKDAVEKTKPALNKKRARAKYEEAIKRNELADTKGAIELLSEAVELDPNVPEYNYNLAKLLFTGKKEVVRSKELCLKAIEHMGDDAEVRITMGQIYKAAGLTKNAIREFKLALKLDKENKTAKMELEELK